MHDPGSAAPYRGHLSHLQDLRSGTYEGPREWAQPVAIFRRAASLLDPVVRRRFASTQTTHRCAAPWRHPGALPMPANSAGITQSGGRVPEEVARHLTERDAPVWCPAARAAVRASSCRAGCQAEGMAPECQPDREVTLTRLRALLDRLIRDGTATARTDGGVHRVFPVAAGPAEGAAIRSWVIREHAAGTVEVELGYGISAPFACEGLLTVGGPEMRHVVIDPHQDTRTAAVGPAGPRRGRSRRTGGVLFRGVADRAAPAACPGAPVRPGHRGWQPPIRRRVRGPVLPGAAAAPGRDRVPRRPPAAQCRTCRPHSSPPTSAGQSRRPAAPAIATTGRFSAPPLAPTPGRSTTSPTSDRSVGSSALPSGYGCQEKPTPQDASATSCSTGWRATQTSSNC